MIRSPACENSSKGTSTSKQLRSVKHRRVKTEHQIPNIVLQGQIQNSPFFKIPLEIRNQIYRYLLSTQYNKEEEPRKKPWRCYKFFQFHTAILSTNHQINREATRVLREGEFVFMTTNQLTFCTYYLFANLRCMVVVEGSLLLKHCSLKLDIFKYYTNHPSYDPEKGETALLTLILAAEDLPLLCKLLVAWNIYGNAEFLATSSISVDLHSKPGSCLWDADEGFPTSLASTRRLLEPLRCLQGLPSVSIDRQLSSENYSPSMFHSHENDPYKVSVLASMRGKLPSRDELVQAVKIQKIQGDEAFEDGKYIWAISKYSLVLQTFSLPDEIYLFPGSRYFLSQFEHELPEHDSTKTCIPSAYSGKATAYLKLGQYEDALAWAIIATSEMDYYYRETAPGGPEGPRRSRAYKVRALANEKVQKLARAVDSMEEALMHDPADSTIEVELERLRMRFREQEDENLEKVGCMLRMLHSGMALGSET